MPYIDKDIQTSVVKRSILSNYQNPNQTITVNSSNLYTFFMVNTGFTLIYNYYLNPLFAFNNNNELTQDCIIFKNLNVTTSPPKGYNTVLINSCRRKHFQ